MANILDASINITITSDLLKSLDFVDIGWTAVRDFSNMFFIFALLYIAIQTILGLAGGGAKRWIAHLIIAAILINFSLFATRVVIDAGNVLAVSVWSKMNTKQGAEIKPSASAKILGGLDLQTTFKKDSRLCFTPLCGGFGYAEMTLAYAGGAIFMFIAGYVLLAGALMMVTRTVMLVILMIFSPFAFMAFGLPKLEQYGHKWLDKLIKQTFVAPFFIFMLYLNSVMVDKLDIFKMSDSVGNTFAGATTGSGEYQIIFNFILMIGFLIASLAVANGFAGGVGSHAQAWAKSATKWAGGMAGGAAVAGGAWGMRQTAGRIGQRTAENAKLQKMADEGNWVQRRFANLAIGSGKALKGSTFDIRNTKMGTRTLGAVGIDAGKGTEKTYGKTGATWGTRWAGGTVGAEQIEKWSKESKERFPNNPAAQEKFMQDQMNEFSLLTKKGPDGKPRPIGKDFYAGEGLAGEAAKKMKEERGRIDREKLLQEKKQVLKDEPANYDKAKADRERLEAEKVRAGTAWTPAQEKTLTDAGTQMSTAAKEIADALKQFTPQEVVDLGKEKMRHEAFIKGYNPSHIQGFNRLSQEGKLNDPQLMSDIGYGVLASGSGPAQTSLRNLAKNGQSDYPFDFKKDMKDYVDEYTKRQGTPGALAAIHTESGKTYDEYLKQSIGKTAGYMGVESISSLEEDHITSDLVVPHLTNKSLQEFVRLNKVEGKFDQAFFDELKRKIVNNPLADGSAQKFIGNATKGTPFNP